MIKWSKSITSESLPRTFPQYLEMSLYESLPASSYHSVAQKGSSQISRIYLFALFHSISK